MFYKLIGIQYINILQSIKHIHKSEKQKIINIRKNIIIIYN